MFGTPWKKFDHPAEVYHLEYPAHWDQVQQDEARSCGFGPHERDDVGLWISILPMSVDTERLADEIPKLMNQMLDKTDAGNPRQDETLKHTGWKADVLKDGQGGNYWILVGGDVVLFASTQVPAAERDTWNPAFDKVMASLQITRDEELLYRQMGNEILTKLKEKHPEEEFHYDDRGIKGKHQKISLNNVFREIKAAPRGLTKREVEERRARIIKGFVDGLSRSFGSDMGYEEWDEINTKVMPILKPREYIDPNTPTKHLYIQDWLTDVVICYVIKRSKYYRFLTGWDLNRWGITGETLHQKAIDNLVRLSWPKRLEGARNPDGSRLIMVMTDDGLGSSRILHPDLHRLFSGPLGTPFFVGIPNRETLVAYSNRRSMKKRIPRQLRKDHDSSAYPITPRPFLVTPDGIALAADS